MLRAEGKERRETLQNKSNAEKKGDMVRKTRAERERERMNEEKAYYQKTDGPPNSQWPHGDVEGPLFAPPGYQHHGEGRGT